jgi:hypothetical protein
MLNDIEPVVVQAKSTGVSALLAGAGIGVQYTSINEFTKASIGIVILFTLIIRAVIAVLELHRKLKEKDSNHE